MDGNNWRPMAPGGEAPVEQVDWRTQWQTDSRQRIVNKIMETLKRHLLFSGPEGLQELKKIAVRFEEKIYTDASSQPDYLRKISLKMLTLENKYQNTIQNTGPVNAASNRDRKPLQQGLAQPKEPLPSPNELTLGCPICLGPLVEETTTRCGHIFCEKCINAALAKQSRCPTCRMPMAGGDLIRVFLGTNISVGEFGTVP